MSRQTIASGIFPENYPEPFRHCHEDDCPYFWQDQCDYSLEFCCWQDVFASGYDDDEPADWLDMEDGDE
jgi:hypothetical protein